MCNPTTAIWVIDQCIAGASKMEIVGLHII